MSSVTRYHVPRYHMVEGDSDVHTDRIVVLAADYDALEAENERLREALEIIAGERQCVDNLLGDKDIAELALHDTRQEESNV